MPRKDVQKHPSFSIRSAADDIAAPSPTTRARTKDGANRSNAEIGQELTKGEDRLLLLLSFPANHAMKSRQEQSQLLFCPFLRQFFNSWSYSSLNLAWSFLIKVRMARAFLNPFHRVFTQTPSSLNPDRKVSPLRPKAYSGKTSSFSPSSTRCGWKSCFFLKSPNRKNWIQIGINKIRGNVGITTAISSAVERISLALAWLLSPGLARLGVD